MYDNIGRKIKGLAIVVFIVEAIAAIIGGIALMITLDDLILLGLLVLLFGPLVAWVSSWLLYGFGEIIDKLCDIERNTRCGAGASKVKNDAPYSGVGTSNVEGRNSQAQLSIDHERFIKLQNLLAQGLITEAEYQQALLKK